MTTPEQIARDREPPFWPELERGLAEAHWTLAARMQLKANLIAWRSTAVAAETERAATVSSRFRFDVDSDYTYQQQIAAAIRAKEPT